MSGECGNPTVNNVTLNPRSLHIFASNVLSRPPEKATAMGTSLFIDCFTAVNSSFFKSDNNNEQHNANSIYINELYVMC